MRRAALLALILIFMLPFVMPLASAQHEEQYAQIVSYSGSYAQFVAKPGETHVMTPNCTVECFSARGHNTVEVLVDNRTVITTNFTGFYWSCDLMLPEKRRVIVVVKLNRVPYRFTLLLVKRAPSPDELKMLEKLVRMGRAELEMLKWQVWGQSALGFANALVVGYLIARWRRMRKIRLW